jgi:hypothetical protein
MWDLTVSAVHTFAVGAGQWVVHNAGGCGPVTKGAQGVADTEAEMIQAGGAIRASEVTFEIQGHGRVRLDTVADLPNGSLTGIEVKDRSRCGP